MADQSYDVIVIGSGAAGLSAALSAVAAGATVAVLERSSKIGGTTAVSGGVAWIPNNTHMDEVGSSDTREAAMTYLQNLSLGKLDTVLAETFLDQAPDVITFLEAHTDLVFKALKWPDYHPELPGGTFGRSVTPTLYPAGSLGEMRKNLRPSPAFPIPFTMNDIEEGVNILDPEIMGERLAADLVGNGNALIAGLLKAVLDKKITVERNFRVRHLVQDQGVVTGVIGESSDQPARLTAKRGVVIACGGFEWNEQLTGDFLRGPLDAAASPPFNEGDGLLMAMAAGARISNTAEAWWMPVMKIPGEEHEGRPMARLATSELTKPGSIMVNRSGRRFVNEACNYNDLGRVFHAFDPVAFDYPNLPAWLIMDQTFFDNYPLMTRYPGDPVPAWLIEGKTLRALAETIGVDADGLEATVANFNENASAGRDPEFKRGDSAYDRYHGDARYDGARRTLGPLKSGPFYACQVYSGALGTKGGPKTNAHAEVMGQSGGIIPGLYAAGNAAAHFTGMSYPGAGGTIGPALVFGHIAGQRAAAASNRF